MMDTKGLIEARLIPTSGINNGAEQEGRATSALLAVMSIVKEFGRSLLAPCGAPAGHMSTFIEPQFDLNGKQVRPDGMIRIERAGRTWVALVEVKTGDSNLEAPQLEAYVEVARKFGFDALITISNQVKSSEEEHPVQLDKRRTKGLSVTHWSWAHLISEAITQADHRGISDPEQAWILRELIRYLEHPRSGADDFADMGPSWVTVRDGCLAGTNRPGDAAVADVVARFGALSRYVAMYLKRSHGVDAFVLTSRSERADPRIKARAGIQTICDSGRLESVIRLGKGGAHIAILADLRAGVVTTSTSYVAPENARASTRATWLTRQLEGSSPALRIESMISKTQSSALTTLGEAAEDPSLLVGESHRPIRNFKVTAALPLGTKRGSGRGSFINSVLASVNLLHDEVITKVKPSVAKPPANRPPEPLFELARIDQLPAIVGLLRRIADHDGDLAGTSTPLDDDSLARRLYDPRVRRRWVTIGVGSSVVAHAKVSSAGRDIVQALAGSSFPESTSFNTLVLADLFVDPDGRGRGTASALIAVASEFARSEGCTLAVLVEPNLASAFERRGYEDSATLGGLRVLIRSPRKPDANNPFADA